MSMKIKYVFFRSNAIKINSLTMKIYFKNKDIFKFLVEVYLHLQLT